jgi:hypothetical protein
MIINHRVEYYYSLRLCYSEGYRDIRADWSGEGVNSKSGESEEEY